MCQSTILIRLKWEKKYGSSTREKNKVKKTIECTTTRFYSYARVKKAKFSTIEYLILVFSLSIDCMNISHYANIMCAAVYVLKIWSHTNQVNSISTLFSSQTFPLWPSFDSQRIIIAIIHTIVMNGYFVRQAQKTRKNVCCVNERMRERANMGKVSSKGTSKQAKWIKLFPEPSDSFDLMLDTGMPSCCLVIFLSTAHLSRSLASSFRIVSLRTRWLASFWRKSKLFSIWLGNLHKTAFCTFPSNFGCIPWTIWDKLSVWNG